MKKFGTTWFLSVVLALGSAASWADEGRIEKYTEATKHATHNPLFAANANYSVVLTDKELSAIRGSGANADAWGYYAVYYANLSVEYLNYARYTAPSNSGTELGYYIYGAYTASLAGAYGAYAAYYSYLRQ